MAGTSVLLVRITEEGEGIPSMLPFCQTSGLKPGVQVKVEAVDGQGVTLLVGGKAAVVVPNSLAKHICFEQES